MNQDQFDFMNMLKKPGRMNAQQTGWYMGFNEQEVTILIGQGLLKPLGNPAPNSVRYFAKAELDHHDSDPRWLHKASAALGGHWRSRNQRLSKKPSAKPRVKNLQRKVISSLRKSNPNPASQ